MVLRDMLRGFRTRQRRRLKVIETHEPFRNVATGVQALAIAVGLMVGGFWAVWVFQARLEKDIAKAKVEREQRELRGRPVVAFELTTTVLGGDASDWLIIAKVTAANTGTRDVGVTFRDWRPINIAKVYWGADGNESFMNVVGGTAYTIQPDGSRSRVAGMTVRAGNRNEIVTCSRVEEPGLYIVSFTASYGPQELEEAKTIAPSEDAKRIYQYARTIYVVVK